MPSALFSQSRTLSITLKSPADSVIALPDNFPDFSRLRIQVDSSFFLQSPSDFSIDTLHRIILLSNPLRLLMFPAGSSSTHRLTVSYFALPIEMKTTYSRHELEASTLGDSLRNLLDSSHHPLERIATTEPVADKGDIFNNFQKSGSISRGFQVGSNRDLSLTSGFNLQFSGDVARDVNITGALTEDNTPIQPEGTTQTLNDIDKVFIRIKAGEHFTSTLGDFVLDLNSPTDPSKQYQSVAPLGITSGRDEAFKAFSQSTFDVISRNLIGAEATAQIDNGSLLVTGAAPRGQFTTNTFQGQEAFQGPYRLSGKNGEPAIIIIAGTEHVYVDGVLQVRGERNDYIIDYALGQVTFQPRRLITSDSRITIDFEYSDQQYSRSLFATNGKAQLFNGAFNLSATYLREGDNQDAPLDLTLSDSDRAILRQAGGNPLAASKSGVVFAGRNAQGIAQGSYVRIDSIVNNLPVRFYRYSPLDTLNALYNVTFGYAGTGNGAYTRLGIGEFQFAGPKLGDYDTLAYLPLPQLHQVMAFSGNARITKNFGLTGEFASSSLAPNRFAAIPSITDNAFRAGALFADTIPIIGYAELRATERHVGKDFTPIDRIEDVEFQRLYGNDVPQTNSLTNALGSSELHQETDLLLRPNKSLILEGGYGDLERQELQFSSQRIYGHAELLEDSGVTPHILLAAERLPTHDSSTHEQALWRRLSGQIGKSMRLGPNGLSLGFQYGEETKNATPFQLPIESVDSLTGNSFHYKTYGPTAQLRLGNLLSFTGEYNYRTEDSARNGALARVNYANTSHFIAALQNLGGFSSTLDLTLRDKHYTDSLSFALNGGNQSTLLLRFEPRYVLASRGISAEALYEISNQRSARLQQIFLPVQPGLGNYQYLGDSNHNGRADPNEFAPARYTDQGNFILISVPTEQLFPTTNLRSSLQLRIAPRDLFELQNAATWTGKALADISSESYIKLNETSLDTVPTDIYFFRLSHFRNDSTTIQGLMEIEQDFNILENDAAQSYRLHYLERESATQYNTGLQRTYQVERSLRARFRPSFELTNETTITSTTDQASSDTLSVNPPHNTSQLGLTTDWSYHPIGSLFDYGGRLELSRAVEHSFDPEATAFTNAVTLRSSYAIETRARLRGQIERDELNLNLSSEQASSTIQLPYALTNGRSVGVTWLWSLALDYQFGSGIVATLAYDGRNAPGDVLGTTGERITVHNARAEVRANF
ncbi:MAG TPA: hypothetical protein VG537_08920 [Candidatus Kapabacteria bacterium]|jgi:hypothetical protein|nr:hypothetical protein [Candidatus Kapabacteria bacterium]